MRFRLFLSGLCLAFAVGRAAEYNIDRAAENVVKFISDAPFEDFEGTTDKIDGYAAWPGGEFGEKIDLTGSDIYFEVPLATLKTGIGMRDRDMREDYLETDNFPLAFFKGTITGIVLRTDSAYDIRTSGAFTVHGVTRSMVINGEVRPEDGRLVVNCVFEVILPDHNIKVPKLLFLRISETIKVELEFYLLAVRKD